MTKKNLHNLNIGSQIERSDERIDKTGEVFTPESFVEIMIQNIPEKDFMNSNFKFIDNSAGSGNILLILKKRLLKYHSEQHILNHMLYAVEFMKDNHQELCERLGVSVDHPHYVCADSLTYDYSFGEPQGVEVHMN
jgi:hypothetical protein